MKTINFFLILIFLLANTECKKSNLNQNNSLLMGGWTLTAIQNVNTYQITNYPDSIPKKESITITDSSSIIKIGGVCNTGWCTYSINGNKISISSMVTTKFLCKVYIPVHTNPTIPEQGDPTIPVILTLPLQGSILG